VATAVVIAVVVAGAELTSDFVAAGMEPPPHPAATRATTDKALADKAKRPPFLGDNADLFTAVFLLVARETGCMGKGSFRTKRIYRCQAGSARCRVDAGGDTDANGGDDSDEDGRPGDGDLVGDEMRDYLGPGDA
jgi:hypothetical protein